MVAMYHLSHLIANDVAHERISVRRVRDPRRRRLPLGVLGALKLRRAPAFRY
jgi:hypothetical protein